MTDQNVITCTVVPDRQRVDVTAELFGIHFPLCLEPMVFDLARRLSPDYAGGLWTFFTLANGGFYMAPDSDRTFMLVCENGFEGGLSADAFGIAVCLYAYSHLSFRRNDFGDVCARHYHLLREFALDHLEAGNIAAATD